MLINDKTTGDIYEAFEFTQFKNETQNAIIGGGEALNASDISQLSKRITLSSGYDDYYLSSYDTGINTYQLTGPAYRPYPYEYKVGLRVRFLVDTDNDSDEVYVKVGSLAAIRVSSERLANGETPVFRNGILKQYDFAELIYQETPDGLTKYFRTIEKPSDVINVDLTGSTWSTLKTLDTNWFVFRADNAYNFSVPYADGNTFAYIATINYKTDSGLYQSLPAKLDFIWITGNVSGQVDNIDVTTDVTPQGATSIILSIKLAQIDSAISPI